MSRASCDDSGDFLSKNKKFTKIRSSLFSDKCATFTRRSEMADPVNITALLIGGGLTLTGTVVGQLTTLFSGWIDRRHKVRILRRERFEELADCVSKSVLWFPKISACRTIEEINANGPPPEARRIMVLALLYFPELRDAAIDYTNGLIKYHGWICDCFSPKVPASAGAQALMVSNQEPQKAILLLRNNLDHKIEEVARKYATV
jgi:hypothetical protein